MAVLKQKHQSMWGVKVYAIVAAMLQKVVNSCSITVERDILNQDCANQVQGHHGVKIVGEQLILDFPQMPNSIQINQGGVHNQEVRILAASIGFQM